VASKIWSWSFGTIKHAGKEFVFNNWNNILINIWTYIKTHSNFMKGYKQLGHEKQTDENASSYEEEVYHQPQHTVLKF
jgi:hypothetical protein